MNRVLLTLVDDIYEDLELWYPKIRLEEAGYAMKVAALERKDTWASTVIPRRQTRSLPKFAARISAVFSFRAGSCPTNSGASATCCGSRESFSSKESWWRSFVTAAGFQSRREFSRANE